MLTSRAPEFIVRYRRAIVFAWLVLAAALAMQARDIDERLAVGEASSETSESTEVERLLASQFGSPFAATAVLVVSGLPSQPDSARQAALGGVTRALRELPFVLRTTPLPTANGGASVPRSSVLMVGVDPAVVNGDSAMISLRTVTATVERRLRVRHPTVALAWTGAPAFNYDVRLTAAADAEAAERRVLPVTLILLCIVFGSVVAALLPITVGVLSIVASLGIAALIGSHWPLTILVRNIVSMLGLGLGIDYALLMVSRFREALAQGKNGELAAIDSLRHAGHTIVVSGAAVSVGFAGLVVVPAVELRSIAIGGLLVTSVSVLLAVTLLPALLAIMGKRVEGGRLWRRRSRDSSDVWRRWGLWIARHPVRVLVLSALPLGTLAWQARRASTDIPSGNWLPAGTESARAAEVLMEMGYSGVVQTIRVMLELPPGSHATTERGWSAIARATRELARRPPIAQARSLPQLLGSERPSASLLSFIPGDLRASYVSRDERLALIELVPREGASPGDLTRLVHTLRAVDVPQTVGLTGTRWRIGGLPAANADYQNAIGGSLHTVVLIVLGGTFIALLIGFRALLVPLKAIVLNLVSVAAAFGAAVLVFQDGHGASLVGLTAPIDGLFPAIPVIVFCIVFGLSMDYEVFLVGRVVEFVRLGVPENEALSEGLARTARVISAAALVMVVVFAGFALGDFLIVKILGFTLATAVFLDATVVRLALGPALLRLAGRWNWWPGRSGRPPKN